MAEQKFRRITAGSNRGKYEVIGSGRIVSAPQVEAYRKSKARREKNKNK